VKTVKTRTAAALLIALSTIVAAGIIALGAVEFNLLSSGTQHVSGVSISTGSIISGDVNGNQSAFVIALDGRSATFYLPTLSVGDSNTIHVTFENTGNVTEMWNLNAWTTDNSVANITSITTSWSGPISPRNTGIATVVVTAQSFGDTAVMINLGGSH
jgi:hypothetical protein